MNMSTVLFKDSVCGARSSTYLTVNLEIILLFSLPKNNVVEFRPHRQGNWPTNSWSLLHPLHNCAWGMLLSPMVVGMLWFSNSAPKITTTAKTTTRKTSSKTVTAVGWVDIKKRTFHAPCNCWKWNEAQDSRSIVRVGFGDWFPTVFLHWADCNSSSTAPISRFSSTYVSKWGMNFEEWYVPHHLGYCSLVSFN